MILDSETIEAAWRRSPFDISPCMVCGQPVVCLPDGLPCCELCEEKVSTPTQEPGQ